MRVIRSEATTILIVVGGLGCFVIGILGYWRGFQQGFKAGSGQFVTELLTPNKCIEGLAPEDRQSVDRILGLLLKGENGDDSN